MRHTVAVPFFVLIAFTLGEAQVQPGGGSIAEQFIFNKERAFVYLQFDHIGKGPRRDETEPAYRIWFHLVNNCRVPIVIRTSGVPNGSPVGEVGFFHKVVANPPLYGVVNDVSAVEPGTNPKPTENPQLTASMPEGYDADVSSTATLQASESLLFSVPVNHLSSKWHIEVPFRFDVTHKRPLHCEANIGGEPRMAVIYGLSDLPANARKQIEAGGK
jgi:hypothetical protein